MASFAIRNPYFIIVLCLICALVGTVSVVRMPVDLFPPIKIPVVVVATFYSGMPPEQIESNITGRFDEVKGDFLFDAADPTKSSVSITIPVASISTGVAKLDEHLLKADFFDATRFPTATFKSTAVTAAGEGKLAVAGDLTIHGVTRPVVLDVTINGIGEHPMRKVPAAGFDASARIKRSDFGVGAYVPTVGDEVTLTITVAATQAK